MAQWLDTTPALKYGPTDLYGSCEAEDCTDGARLTCSVCGGQFCRSHGVHEAHRESADDSGR
ncbi:MAG: hypothetical protein QOK10_630 [Pseudonocardiales bacterium]|nr:hypothetical protein [Pseudonocardiales bacterium]